MSTNGSASASSTRVLFLESTVPFPKSIRHTLFILFAHLTVMVQYLNENIKKSNKFILVIASDQLRDLVHHPIFQRDDITCVHVICDHSNDADDYRAEYIELQKLQFSHKENLESLLRELQVDIAIDSRGSKYMAIVKGVASSLKEAIVAKRSSGFIAQSSPPKRFAAGIDNAGRRNDTVSFTPNYTCCVCDRLFQEPCVLPCGHRFCKSCIDTAEQEITCRTCSKVSTGDQVRRDRGLERDMQLLSVWCSSCSWKGTYRDFLEHLDNQHSDRNASVDPVLIVGHITLASEASSSALHTLNNGSHIWKITNFQQRLDAARSGQQSFIYSPSFYSSPSGYKMRLKVYLNGDTNACGKYVSVFLIIMKGDHDDNLQWPFLRTVSIRAIDQSTRSSYMVGSFFPDVNSLAYQKPTSNVNDAFGLATCIPCGQLQKETMHPFVKNDVVLVEINVSTPYSALSFSSSVSESAKGGEHFSTHK